MDKLVELAKWAAELTSKKVATLLLFAAGSITLYVYWEHRDATAQVLSQYLLAALGNAVLGYALVLSVSLLVFVSAAKAVLREFQKRSDELRRHLETELLKCRENEQNLRGYLTLLTEALRSSGIMIPEELLTYHARNSFDPLPKDNP